MSCHGCYLKPLSSAMLPVDPNLWRHYRWTLAQTVLGKPWEILLLSTKQMSRALYLLYSSSTLWRCNIDMWANALPRRVIADSTPSLVCSLEICMPSLLSISSSSDWGLRVSEFSTWILARAWSLLLVVFQHCALIILSSFRVFISDTFGSTKESASRHHSLLSIHAKLHTTCCSICSLTSVTFHGAWRAGVTGLVQSVPSPDGSCIHFFCPC